MDSPKRLKKRSYTTKHSKEIMDLALDALRKKTLSSYQAEKVFGIPRRTLLDKLHNKHPKNPGGPTRLTDEEEANIVKVLIAASEYGCPLNLLDLRIVVHRYLETIGRRPIFENKLPGKKWAYQFIKRNKSKLSYRIVQNIKRSRAEKNPDEMNEYFANLKSSLEGVAVENILNYDETNLSDNPGTQKCLFKRGVKYPERVLNSTKGSISIMFSITAGGECLPPYVVYKAEHLYTQWTLNGPKGTRFNRSKSGWFDSIIFEDWFKTIVVPWATTKTGTKVLIGDNLASHINYEIVTYCEQNDIKFIFLPPNSTHLTQPLDVCYFGPLKKIWREILANYKMKNPREAAINKGHFPELLKILMARLNGKTHNIISAFKSTGIAPFDPTTVIKKLVPDSENPACTIDRVLLDWLKENRAGDPNKKIRNKKINVIPGKSVSTQDFQHLIEEKTAAKKVRKTNKQSQRTRKQKELSAKPILQENLLILKNPNTLKKLCTMVINDQLIKSVQDPVLSSSQSSNICMLRQSLKNDETNMTFIGEAPKCLQTNKTKITIISDVTIPAAGPEKNEQVKQDKIKYSQKEATITRSALHLKLLPMENETVAIQNNVLKEITHEIELEQNTKPNKKNRRRKIKDKVITKAKPATRKYKSVKQRKNRISSESSSINSDVNMYMADTDDSDYATLEDYIKTTIHAEQENIEPTPSIPYGISDIEYFKKEHNPLKTDSWILAKFVTKKSLKHFVGKVISIHDNIPKVKFVRKVKESKNSKGFVFTYPRVDDICSIKHEDDVILVLPKPDITRRGQIVFNLDLTSYNIQ